MKVGVIVPQGWTGEYDGGTGDGLGPDASTSPRQATSSASSRSGCSTTSTPCLGRPTRSPSSRSRSLSALAAVTKRVRLGHVVICTAFRNPALTAKMISTMDVISGGRMELGIGAGWKRDEWDAYGYGFPETRERLASLGDDLEVMNRMMAGDRHQHATFEGELLERRRTPSTSPSRSSSRGCRSWSAATGPT